MLFKKFNIIGHFIYFLNFEQILNMNKQIKNFNEYTIIRFEKKLELKRFVLCKTK